MLLNYLTLLVALSISGIAIYYSVAGLVAIFASSVIPVIIMGSVLEVGKLITAVWLHRHWYHAVWWLKAYLSVAVIILMIITSLGIFGYLSQSHIQQTTASAEQTARIALIDTNIARSNAIIDRTRHQIESLLDGSSTARVDTLVSREKESLKEINATIASEQRRIRSDIDTEEERLSQINNAIERDRERLRKQYESTIIEMKGAFDRKREEYENTLSTLDHEYKNSFFSRDTVATKIKALKKDFSEKEAIFSEKLRQQKQDITVNIQRDIAERYDRRVSEVELRISSLKKQYDSVDSKYVEDRRAINNRIAELTVVTNKKTSDVDQRIAEHEEKIKVVQTNIGEMMIEKAELESQYRQLEAEVGPIKYIAEFIYDDAERDLLEDAVRWVIVTIIFVFDPLAVLLLIASQYSFERTRTERETIIPVIEEPMIEEPMIEEPAKPLPKVKKPVNSHPINKGLQLKSDADGYIRYKNKAYQVDAFIKLFPEMKIDLRSEVSCGTTMPSDPKDGMMFIDTGTLPTKLYRFNGNEWDGVDKRLLERSAYSREYVSELISTINDNEYDPILLEALLKEGTDDNKTMVLTAIEIELINDYEKE